METLKVGEQVAQGDVFITALGKIGEMKLPSNSKMEEMQPKDGKIIVAYGEATGHHHYLPSEKVEARRVTSPDGNEAIILKVLDAVEIRHQQHGPIKLTPQYYLVENQIFTKPNGALWMAAQAD